MQPVTSPSIAPNVRTVGFLGPRGTFTEQALRTQPDLAAAELITFPSMPDVLFAVEEGAIDLGFVAIENAIEGTVNATVDTLAFEVDLSVQREVVIPIRMCLLGLPGADVSAVREVVSFGHASAQCRKWLRAHLPGAAIVQSRSTAEGAATVASGGDTGIAAIANELAAETYGLEVLAAGIEDHVQNATRFVVVGRHLVPPPSGADKTSLVVYQKADRPGSLLAILHEFAGRSLNLTLLLSRPTKTSLGDYCFLLDVEGHISDPIVGDCVRTLQATQGGVKFLGSFPVGSTPHRPPSATAEFHDADQWLADLRGRVVRP